MPVALAGGVVRAIHHNANAVIPLNVPNNGNIPELENIARQLVYLCPAGRPVDVNLLPERVRQGNIQSVARVDSSCELDLEKLVGSCEQAAIREALRPLRDGAQRLSDEGTSKLVEGKLEPGETVMIVEDVLTTGGQVIEGARSIEAVDEQTALVVDRQAEGSPHAGRPAGRKPRLDLCAVRFGLAGVHVGIAEISRRQAHLTELLEDGTIHGEQAHRAARGDGLAGGPLQADAATQAEAVHRGDDRDGEPSPRPARRTRSR